MHSNKDSTLLPDTHVKQLFTQALLKSVLCIHKYFCMNVSQTNTCKGRVVLLRTTRWEKWSYFTDGTHSLTTHVKRPTRNYKGEVKVICRCLDRYVTLMMELCEHKSLQ